VKITVLGTGTAAPSLLRGSSSYLVSSGGYHAIVDIGPAVLRRIIEQGYVPDDIDAIFLTHFHVDHSSDLAAFLFASNYGGPPRRKPLLLAGGRGLDRFLARLRIVYPWIVPLHYDLTVCTLPHPGFEAGGMAVESAPVRHRRESVALRFQGRGSVTFSGDTGYCRSLVNLARDTDLLVTECSFPDEKVKGHLNLRAVQRIASESRARRVLLSHLYPAWEEFRGVLRAPLLLAADGMECEVGPTEAEAATGSGSFA
jgi:ribonuclease BN (tRNA processing enzyme)